METNKLRYPYNIDGSGDFIKFSFYDYKAPFATGPSTTLKTYNSSAVPVGKPVLNDIYITMPNDVDNSFKGNWGGRNLTGLAMAAFGTAGAAIKTAGTGKVDLNAFKQQAQQTTSAILGGLAEDALKTLTTSVNNAPGLGSNLSTNDVLGLVSGFIVNPNTELLYQGTDLRTHGYNFKLIAFSEKEAEAIDEIVNTFKKAILPSGATQKFLGLEGRNFIGIPYVCQVSFFRGGGVENNYLPKYKLSAITDVSVDYITDGQYMTFEDGRPIGVNLKVTFTELKLVFREEIGKTVR